MFLDTNVFLYAAGADHMEKVTCEALLTRVARGTVAATTSTEVVQELIYVLTRRGRGSDGVRLARSVLRLFPSLLPVRREDMRRACDLLERHPSLPPRDAVHAATMEGHGIGTIVSADDHFDVLTAIKRVTPANAK